VQTHQSTQKQHKTAVDRIFPICYNTCIVIKKEPKMQNWTDKIIHWNQLPGTEVKRLLATWGMTPEQIAKYDKKNGFANSASKAQVPVKAEKTAKPIATPVAKKAVAKPAARQKHTGADGAIKFVEHRNLYVGFFGGKVVVTKRTVDACRAVLLEQYGIEGVKVDA
jgi:hypothetical protein